MRDIDRALADITRIRSQLTAGTLFRGFGPTVIALTGGLAVVTAVSQSIWPAVLAPDPPTFLLCWVGTAVISAMLIGFEMLARSRRHHGGLADAMIWNAIEQFMPAGAAGVALGVVFLKFLPDALWMLPALWQVLVAVGIFAWSRSLPQTIIWVGGWYFLAGICVLIISSLDHMLTPWMMGIPFAAGQFLMAAVLHFASGEIHAEE